MTVLELKQLLAKDQAQQVIQILLDCTEAKKDLFNRVVMLSGRFRALQMQERSTLLPPSELFLYRSRIDNDLLHLLDEIETDCPGVLNTKKQISKPSSKSAPESQGFDIVERLNRAFENKSAFVFKVFIPKKNPEEAELVRLYAEKWAKEADFKTAVLNNFSTVFHELVTNAFEHGSKNYTDQTGIQIGITQSYLNLEVINSRPIDFNLEVMRRTKRQALAADSKMKRGRGLLLVEKLADAFGLIDRFTLKATFHKEAIEFAVVKVGEDFVLIEVLSGAYNPSLFSKLQSEITRLLSKNVSYFIISFRLFRPDCLRSQALSEILDTTEIIEENNSCMVVLGKEAGRFSDSIPFPEYLIAESLKAALIKIGRTDLFDQIDYIETAVQEKTQQYFTRT